MNSMNGTCNKNHLYDVLNEKLLNYQYKLSCIIVFMPNVMSGGMWY